jgi:CO/xanthine dehydrogenase Mo-binding subunit
MRKRGIGIASSFQGVNYHFGHPDESHARLEINDVNVFIIHAAASDLGQGLEASLIKIVSDAFGGLPAKYIQWAGANTNEPEAGSTGASRQTTITGNALLIACKNLKNSLSGVAAEMLDIHPDKIKFEGELVRGDGTQISITQLLVQARLENLKLEAEGKFVAPPTTAVDDLGKGNPINQFGYATHVAEVEVDVETGEVSVLRIKAYHDAGKILHQMGAEGQVEGGIVMGLGFALSEEFLQDKGIPLNVGFANYLIPTIADSPEIETHFIETQIPMGELGVKGLAEIPTSTIAPAIINAIFDATGARITRIPATPERVLSAIKLAEEKNEPRS